MGKRKERRRQVGRVFPAWMWWSRREPKPWRDLPSIEARRGLTPELPPR